MIYVPNYNSNNCVVIQDKDTIRVYESTPTDNVEVSFTDYFINSHYLSQSGSIIYGSNSFLDTCVDSQNISTDFYYRNDLDSILVIFFIITLVCFYFPFKVFSRAFGRWLKV